MFKMNLLIYYFLRSNNNDTTKQRLPSKPLPNDNDVTSTLNRRNDKNNDIIINSERVRIFSIKYIKLK